MRQAGRLQRVARELILWGVTKKAKFHVMKTKLLVVIAVWVVASRRMPTWLPPM